MGLSSRCGGCTTTTTTGDVTRNRSSNNDGPPEAVLEGLAMAGLVAILCQLGDLAELAAEVLDDMQDQVMAASARGRRLAVRAKRLLLLVLEDQADDDIDLDLDLPPPTTSTHNSAAAALTITTIRGGVGGRTPRLVVQRILRRCRGPPRLSLLDKFDGAGEGACLKRYTDPSFFRAHYYSANQQRLLDVDEQQGTLLSSRVRSANQGPSYLKSMSMETTPKFRTALNSEPPESAHSTDSKSETETETETAPSPGFLSMLRHLKQQHRHREAAAGARSLFPTQLQTAAHRVQIDIEKKQKLQGACSGTAQLSPSPSPSELQRTSSFEAWLSPDACRFTHHHEHDQTITQEPLHHHPHGTATCSGSVSHVVPAGNTSDADVDAALSSSSTMLKANKFKAGASNKSRSSRRYNKGTCGDRHPTCTSPDSKNLLLPGSLVLERTTGALPEQHSCSEEHAKVDTTPPIAPMQWLSEKVHTGTPVASPKHRALWKKSLEGVGRADRSNSVATQVHEKIQAISQATSVSIENANANASRSRRDETKCSEETSHPQPFRVQEEDVVQASSLKAGEFPVPAILSEEAYQRTQAQANTCFQQQGRLQFGSSGHSLTEKRGQEHDEASDSSSSSNLQNESVFFSAVQELAKMSPPLPPSVPRITLRNGPSLIHPSRNILDSRSVLIKQIKDIEVAGNPSFELKPVS